MQIDIKIKKDNPELEWKCNHSTDACFDIQYNENTVVPAKGKAIVSTGVYMEIPVGYMMQVKPRSGLAAKFGIDTGAGVIDCDYRGEIKIVLFNHSNEDFEIKQYDRIAQGEIRPVYTANFITVDEHEETTRGDKGFGSSGV
jgi:dUTP pyrophosphatase